MNAQPQWKKYWFGNKRVRHYRSKYLGEFCWQYESDEGPGDIKLGVFHMGGGHFMLSGKAIEGLDSEWPISGNAEFIGEELVLYLQSAGGGLNFPIPFPDPDNPQIVNVVGTVAFYVRMEPETLEGEALVLEATAFEEDPEGFKTGIQYGGVWSMIPVGCD